MVGGYSTGPQAPNFKPPNPKPQNPQNTKPPKHETLRAFGLEFKGLGAAASQACAALESRVEGLEPRGLGFRVRFWVGVLVLGF